MIIEKVDSAGRAKLQLALESYTHSFAKRNVAFVNMAHSKTVGSIRLIVTGRRGSAQKDFVVMYNKKTEQWDTYSEGVKYSIDSLTEIATIIKSKIQKLAILLGKI